MAQTVSHHFNPAGVPSRSTVLASNTPSAPFKSIPGRDCYLELIGAGSATITVTYLCADGATFAPNVVATDGGAPTIMDKIAYNGATQNGVRIALHVERDEMTIRAEPGTVTGSITATFVA